MAKEVEVKFTVSGVDGSIKDLSDLVKALNKTEEATEDLQDQQKESADNTGFLQDRFNGLKDTAKKLGQDFKSVIGVLGKTGKASTVLGRVMQSALVASGIGIVLVAVTALISYFKNFEVVTRVVQKAINGLGAIFSQLGKSISALLRGDFKGAGKAFKDIGKEVKAAAAATDDLFDAQKRLADIQKRNATQNAKTRQEIEAYKKQLEDTTLSEQKRLSALDEVTKRTKALAQAQLDENQAQIDGLEAKIKLENNEVARRDLEVELAQLRAERIDQQTELNNIEYDALKVGREIRAEAKARREEEKKAKEEAEAKKAEELAAARQEEIANAEFVAEAMRQIDIQSIKDAVERAKAEIEVDKEKQLALLASKGATEEELLRIEEFYDAKKAALDKEAKDAEVKVEEATMEQKMDIAASAFGAIAMLTGEQSAIGKAAAISATVINTIKGAMSAYADTPGGPVLKGIAAGVATATGLAAIKQIASTPIPGNESAGSVPTPTFRPRRGATGAAGNLVSNFNTINTVTPDEPQKVYVVAGDVTNAQEADKKIKDTARL